MKNGQKLLLSKKNNRLKNSLGIYYDMCISSSNSYLSLTSTYKVANMVKHNSRPKIIQILKFESYHVIQH